ncbi:MAG: class I SAM-dependent methyltransferase [Pirellulales bacterium]|nr:class I SAM-dependent methyltransferase [Pirellulales bacterium]
MDTLEEARDYDSMDHNAVNRAFVIDMLVAGEAGVDVLDLGTGTAQIPLELCRQLGDCRVKGVDLSMHMLDLARINIEQAGFTQRISVERVDAKRLPFDEGSFHAVMSNSIVHHIPDPMVVLAEAVRVTLTGGLLFFRDLMRPQSRKEVARFVRLYAGNENPRQRKMFEESLCAALSLVEIRMLVGSLGFAPETVQASSDRHWTWCATKP